MFKEWGFEETSIRDIASKVGILPGSIYYHFESKDELFVAVYRAGIDVLSREVRATVSEHRDPWERFKAACATQLRIVLGEDDCASTVMSVPPQECGALYDQLTVMRDEYEEIFKTLIQDLPLRKSLDQKYLRLAILGALNHAVIWYRPGLDDPETIANRIVEQFIDGEKAPD